MFTIDEYYSTHDLLNMTDLNVLKIFVAAAESGGFSKAATSLGLTRSAVAKAIARLEQNTDTRLFHRTTRVMTLTDEGRVLFERCAGNIDSLEQALQDMSYNRNEPRGVLRITMPDAYGRSQIMPVLTDYLARWPKLQSEVSFSDRTIDFIADGYDLAIRLGGQNVSEDLVSRVIARERLSFCASPEYLQRIGEPASPEELKMHSGVHFVQHGRTLPWRLKSENGEPLLMDTSSRIRFDAGEAVRDAAIAGFGIAQMPHFLVGAAFEAGTLKRIMVKYEPDLMPVVVLYPTRKFLAPKVRLFIDSLIERNL